MRVVRSKVATAILGVFVIGGASGGLGAVYAAHGLPSSGGNAPSSASVAQIAGSTPTSTARAQGPQASLPVGTPNPMPTDTPAPNPTATPRPTATPLPVGQQVTIRGTISSLSSSGFVLKRQTSSVVISVTNSTLCQGAATTCGGLRNGMFATVTGIVQPDGSVVASTVSTSTDN